MTLCRDYQTFCVALLFIGLLHDWDCEMNNFGIKTHIVFAYQDMNFITTAKAYEGTYENLVFYGDFGKLELAGKKIFFLHHNGLAREIAENGNYDVVFYGHNHLKKIETVGKTLFVNPGELMGKKANPSIAVYDTETNTAEIVEL